MTKTKLVSNILKVYPYMSAANVNQIISIFLNEIVETLKDGGRVELRGFGSFGVKERALEKKRNPKTGEIVWIDARKIPFFKSGKQLRMFINDADSSEEGDEDESDNIIRIDSIKKSL